MAASACKGHASLAVLAGALLAGSLAGCGSTQHVYTVQPTGVVVRPAADPWGVDVALEIEEAIHVAIANTSQEPVRILWEECAYVDVDGRSHRLQAVGHDPAVPSLESVAPGARVDAVLTPVSRPLRYSSDPLLPGRPAPGPKPTGLARWWPFQRAAAGQDAVGKPVSVFLVLERDTHRRTVLASYTIADVRTGRR